MGQILRFRADLEAFHVHTQPKGPSGVSFRIEALPPDVREHRHHHRQFAPEEGDVVGALDCSPMSKALPG